MFSIDVDFSVEAQLLMMASRVPLAIENGLNRVGLHAQQIALREAGKIYARSIPRRKSGKAMWKRSGNLLTSLRAPLQITTGAVTLSANTPYAQSRHGLGVSWTPRKPALGIIRKNAFFADTRALIEPQITPLFEDGLREGLNL